MNQHSAVIDKDLFHLHNQILSFLLVQRGNELFIKLVKFLIVITAVIGSVCIVWRKEIISAVSVPVQQEGFRVSGSHSNPVTIGKVIIAFLHLHP